MKTTVPESAHASDDAGQNKRATLQLGPALSARLRRAAQARNQTLQELGQELLDRGLTQETLSQQARTTLQALTPRERDVAQLILLGRTNRQIAAALYISTETVRTHVRHVLEKFGASSKADFRLRLRRLDISPESRRPAA